MPLSGILKVITIPVIISCVHASGHNADDGNANPQSTRSNPIDVRRPWQSPTLSGEQTMEPARERPMTGIGVHRIEDVGRVKKLIHGHSAPPGTLQLTQLQRLSEEACLAASEMDPLDRPTQNTNAHGRSEFEDSNSTATRQTKYSVNWTMPFERERGKDKPERIPGMSKILAKSYRITKRYNERTSPPMIVPTSNSSDSLSQRFANVSFAKQTLAGARAERLAKMQRTITAIKSTSQSKQRSIAESSELGAILRQMGRSVSDTSLISSRHHTKPRLPKSRQYSLAPLTGSSALIGKVNDRALIESALELLGFGSGVFGGDMHGMRGVISMAILEDLHRLQSRPLPQASRRASIRLDRDLDAQSVTTSVAHRQDVSVGDLMTFVLGGDGRSETLRVALGPILANVPFEAFQFVRMPTSIARNTRWAHTCKCAFASLTTEASSQTKVLLNGIAIIGKHASITGLSSRTGHHLSRSIQTLLGAVGIPSDDASTLADILASLWSVGDKEYTLYMTATALRTYELWPSSASVSTRINRKRIPCITCDVLFAEMVVETETVTFETLWLQVTAMLLHGPDSPNTLAQWVRYARRATLHALPMDSASATDGVDVPLLLAVQREILAGIVRPLECEDGEMGHSLHTDSSLGIDLGRTVNSRQESLALLGDDAAWRRIVCCRPAHTELKRHSIGAAHKHPLLSPETGAVDEDEYVYRLRRRELWLRVKAAMESGAPLKRGQLGAWGDVTFTVFEQFIQATRMLRQDIWTSEHVFGRFFDFLRDSTTMLAHDAAPRIESGFVTRQSLRNDLDGELPDLVAIANQVAYDYNVDWLLSHLIVAECYYGPWRRAHASHRALSLSPVPATEFVNALLHDEHSDQWTHRASWLSSLLYTNGQLAFSDAVRLTLWDSILPMGGPSSHTVERYYGYFAHDTNTTTWQTYIGRSFNNYGSYHHGTANNVTSIERLTRKLSATGLAHSPYLGETLATSFAHCITGEKTTMRSRGAVLAVAIVLDFVTATNGDRQPNNTGVLPSAEFLTRLSLLSIEKDTLSDISAFLSFDAEVNHGKTPGVGLARAFHVILALEGLAPVGARRMHSKNPVSSQRQYSNVWRPADMLIRLMRKSFPAALTGRADDAIRTLVRLGMPEQVMTHFRALWRIGHNLHGTKDTHERYARDNDETHGQNVLTDDMVYRSMAALARWIAEHGLSKPASFAASFTHSHF